MTDLLDLTYLLPLIMVGAKHLEPLFYKIGDSEIVFWNLGQELLNTIPNLIPIHLKWKAFFVDSDMN